jgi:hypothetical protein
MYLQSYPCCTYCKVLFAFKVNFSAVQNDPIYLFMKSDLILKSVSTVLVYNYVISLVPWMLSLAVF